jgi:hypothetical protein
LRKEVSEEAGVKLWAMLVIESDLRKEVDHSLNEIAYLNALFLAEIRCEFGLQKFHEEG